MLTFVYFVCSKSRHVQFVMFFICQFKPEFAVEFTKQLVKVRHFLFLHIFRIFESSRLFSLLFFLIYLFWDGAPPEFEHSNGTWPHPALGGTQHLAAPSRTEALEPLARGSQIFSIFFFPDPP